MEPLLFRCTACRKMLKVGAEYAGRKVRCTGCGAVLMAPGGAAADPRRPARDVVPDKAAEQAPASFKRALRPGDWRVVRTGVDFIFWALCVEAAAVVLGGCAGVVGVFEGGRGAGLTPARVFTAFVLVTALGGEALAGLGYWLCVAAPSRHGARALAAAALVLSGVALAFGGLALAMIVAGGGLAGPGLLLLFAGAQLARLVTFLIYLRAVGRILGARSLVKDVGRLLVLGVAIVAFWGVMMVGTLLTAVGALTLRMSTSGVMLVGMGLTCGTPLLLLLWLAWYILTLRSAVFYLDDHVERGA